MNKIKRAPDNLNPPNINGVIDYAINLIDFDDVYYDAFYLALGDTLIVEDRMTAQKLIGKYRMVDLDGSLYDKSAAITGGSMPQNRMKFSSSENQELESCKKKLNEFQDLADTLDKKKRDIEQKIDIEEKNWDSANFGSCLHKVLENAQRTRLEKGVYPDLQSMIDDFNKEIDVQRFSDDSLREKFEKDGVKILEDYYEEFISPENDKIHAVEFSFDGVKVDKYELSGKIDRIEKNLDRTYTLCDYKSGNPVSEKQVEKDGKSSAYYNQLCFYKLLPRKRRRSLYTSAFR